MLKRILESIKVGAIAVLLFCAVGCRSSHEMMSNGTLDADLVEELNSRAEKKQATILLADGSQAEADAFRIEGVSATWLEPSSRKARSTSVSDIVEITFTSRGNGAAKGYLIGALAGGLFGATLGLAQGDDPPTTWSEHCGEIICLPVPDRISVSAEVKATVTGLLLGGTAGLVGLVTGAIHGDRTFYQFQPGQSYHRQPDSAFQSPVAVRNNQ